ncbi:chemokine XC receptor 1-like isoform X1 [Scleropages formosus]|uniref:chemokine XC receptor 1-like isoform X1 n=1 Tax=Scleropages formosus TaxID=113540 RepID=UPI0010FACDE4|nr:chemokine XC receptor 1-like isoform X1 [Scleropages formosus]
MQGKIKAEMDICEDSLCTAPLSNGTGIFDNYSYDYPNESWIFLEEDESEKFGGFFSGVLYCLVFSLSLIGNSLLLWALLKHEDKTKAWNIFLLNLTVSDLLFTMPLPFWAVYQFHQWVFGDLACKLLSGVFFIGLYSYMFFLVVITIDRYGAVVTSTYSWQTRRPLHAHFVSGGVWLVCTAASIPDVIFSETMETLGGTVCAGTPRPLHVELLMYCIQILLFFLVPFSVIMFCYTKMWTIIVRCRSSQKHKAAKLILGIVIGFFVCWAPYNVLFFLFSLKSLGWDALVLEKLHYAYYICHCLAYCHCCLNPIFHIFGSRKFRTYFFLISGSSSHQLWRQNNITSRSSNQRMSVSNQTFV